VLFDQVGYKTLGVAAAARRNEHCDNAIERFNAASSRNGTPMASGPRYFSVRLPSLIIR
jgi:hypothetical protein